MHSNTQDELKEVKKLDLQDIAGSDNVAEFLNKKELDAIGSKVLADYELDKKSMEGWLSVSKNAMDLCKMGATSQEMNTDGANIHYPLITTAVMQFTARSVAEMSKSGKVAKFKVLGQDKAGAKSRKGHRVATHLNYQVQEQIADWFSEMEKLHNQLSICGTSFTKTHYDPIIQQVKVALVPYDCIFVNNAIKSVKDAPRISELISLSHNDIVESQRYGLFLDIYKPEDMVMDETDPEPIYHEVLEQHTFLDLDKDGLKEPYVVTYHLAHKCILRIAPRFEYLKDRTVFLNDKGKVKRIVADEYYTAYPFVQSLDGTFFGIGFGTLLKDTNHTINTLLNQLVDAGTLANMQGGFLGKDLRLKKEDLIFERGEFKIVDSANGTAIADNVYQFMYKEPSQVLLQLMQTLLEGANNLTSTSEILSGTMDATNASPNSVAMLAQQGLKVSSSIQRRIFRSFKQDLQKIIKLNARYTDKDEYMRIIDPSPQEQQEMFDEYGQLKDYVLEDVDIVPVVDIEDSTELETLNKTQALMQIGTQFVQMGATDPTMLALTVYKGLGIENIEALVPAPPEQEAPNPEALAAQQELQIKMKELELKEKELQIKAAEVEARIQELNASAAKLMQEAQNIGSNAQLASNKQQLEASQHHAKIGLELEKLQASKDSDREYQNIERSKAQNMARRPGNPNIT